MVLTDPIADFLTRIRNANMAKHDSVEIPASNIKKSLAEILKHEGFIKDYAVKAEEGKPYKLRISRQPAKGIERLGYCNCLNFSWYPYRQGS